MNERTRFLPIFLSFSAMLLASAPAQAANAYPTAAVADYVLGCMIANDRSPETLQRCSCSIDVIASILPYEEYEAAETFERMGQLTGEKGVIFRQTAPAKNTTAALRRAQAEADMRCF